MSSPTPLSIPTIAEFLANGLTPHTPEDIESECTICAMSWKSEPDKIVRLPCLHEFHEECIERWIQDGVGASATCPCCRLTLCKRPVPLPRADDDELQFLINMGPVTDEGWEGLYDAFEGIRTNLQSIYQQTYRAWTECEGLSTSTDEEEDAIEFEAKEDPMEWTTIICQLVHASEIYAGVLPPGSVFEYAVVKAFIDSLKSCWGNEGLEISSLEEALEILDDYEEHGEDRSIEDAYAAVGLSELVPTWTNVG